ncbi:MAG: PrpF domain-containing protein [Clostridium sp.]
MPFDILEPEGYPSVEATLIDCSNPVMILASKNLGLEGGEIEPFLSDKELSTHIEAIRSAAAVKYGFVEHAKDATEQSLAAPKVAVISRPHDFKGSDGNMILKEDMDICSRIISVGAFHKTHPITSGIALAAAASIPGTVAWNLIERTGITKTLKIGHPCGILPDKNCNGW